jgi:frequency clock protein
MLFPSFNFVADDPPFFLRNSSSETTPPEIRLQRAREADLTTEHPSNPIPDSISDEYRSVIDDLTIENKRLKRRMRKYERLQNEHLHSQALFEVRYYGLPPEKRRELEDLLRDFVTKVGDSPLPSTMTKSPSALDSSALALSALPSSLMAGPSSSSHPMSRVSGVGDSGYASMSALGQNSSTQSGKRANDQKLAMSSERKKDIQNYLSDIPPGLFPTRTGYKSEKERRREVVRRLEQLFAGRDPSGAHYQTKQQERVAQSAARHDRRATEAAGAEWKEEGAREARIMPKVVTPNHTKPNPSPSSDSQSKSDQDKEMTDASNNDQLVEQRPTRPLDIDPQRAQVPSENIDYLTHLGFSPPDTEEEIEARPDGHGWIHLNILANMAQLHFLNVTTSFVQRAIKENSKMLELSPDGRKVRWKGGRGVTLPSNESSPYRDSVMGDTNAQHPGSKMGTSSSLHPNNESGHGRRARHKLAYSPLFRTREDSEAEAGMDDEINYRLSNLQTSDTVDSPGQRNLGKQRVPVQDDSAPVIFYQNLGFYTDLSGEPISEAVGLRSSNYKKMLTLPIGTGTAARRAELLQRLEYEKGPISRSKMSNDSSPEYSGPNSVGSSGLKVIHAPKSKDLSSPSSTETQDPMELEASGIGGVQPADNFSISVRSKQQREEGSATPNYRRSKNIYPMPIRNALLAQRKPTPADTVAVKVNTNAASPSQSSNKKPNARSFIEREILTAKTKDLPASTLPEAVFFYHNSDDDSDDDEEEDGEIDVDDDDDDDDTASELEMPKSALQHMDWAAIVPGSGTEAGSSSDDDEDDEDDEDNVDDLYTHPPRSRSLAKSKRSSVPSVRAGASRPPPRSDASTSEGSNDEEEESPNENLRESASTLAQRMAEDIPLGNSAASGLAGNNSGFTSPTYNTATQDKTRHGLKRARNSDDSVPGRTRKSPKVDRGPSDRP